MAMHSGFIGEIVYGWKRKIFMFPKKTVSGKRTNGFLYHKTKFIMNAEKSIRVDYYATGNEFFKLKLKGLA